MVQGNCLLVNKLITLCFPLGPNQIQLEGIYGSRSSISSVVAIGGEALKVEKGRESINATRERNQSNTNIYKIQSSFYSL